jgi:toxoflavin biosynthesis protein ToxD
MSTPSPAIPRIFVSHSHQDDAFTARLVADLRATGADVWVDTDKITYNDFVQHISDGLANRDWLVLVQTPDALRSPWVRTEVNAALNMSLQGRMRGVIPVLAKACDPADMPALWSTLQYYDATRDYNTAVKKLLAVLGLSAPTATPLAASAPSAPTSPQARPAARPPSPAPSIPPDRFPPRLAGLGFTAHSNDGVEYILPPLCPIPAGPFLMGSDLWRDPNSGSDEQPQHSITLPAYQIARYPVTVAEYACFVRVGYAAPVEGFLGVDWDTQLQHLDHPITCVSWHDAVAYAAWLTQRTGQHWRLPSEAEWEKAARGADGRIYPWGDTFDASRCNTRESGRRSTTPAGRYPTGTSSYDVQDMVGNVWEWTSTIFKSYHYNQSDGREAANSTDDRVLRGGSWNSYARIARAARRYHNWPPSLDADYGFRLAAAAPVQVGS